MNFNEKLWKDVTYDNIKSHKKPGFRPLFRSYIFQKPTGGWREVGSALEVVLGLTTALLGPVNGPFPLNLTKQFPN